MMQRRQEFRQGHAIIKGYPCLRASTGRNVEINTSVTDPREIAIGMTSHRSQRVRKQHDITSKGINNKN